MRKRKNLFLIFSGVVGIVMIWRGVWGLADAFLFPDHPEVSFFISIVGGLIILLADDFELEELSPNRGVGGQMAPTGRTTTSHQESAGS